MIRKWRALAKKKKKKQQPENNRDIIITLLLTRINAKKMRRGTEKIKGVNYFRGIPWVPKQLHGQLLAACLTL